MLSTRKAGHMVREIGQRLDTNSCGWEQCKKYMLCKGLGLMDDRGVQTVPVFSAPNSNLVNLVQFCKWYLGICVALRSTIPKIPGELGGQLGPPGGQEERLPSLQLHPSLPPK